MHVDMAAKKDLKKMGFDELVKLLSKIDYEDPLVEDAFDAFRKVLKKTDFAELTKLLSKIDNENPAFDDAISEVRERQLAAIPIPTCCEDAKNFPSIRFHVDVYKSGERSSGTNAPGQWYAATLQSFSDVVAQRLYKNGSKYPVPKVCNYCGTKLPRMVRKKKFPANTCVVTDSGYRCDTCRQRLSGCLCLPPEFAWEKT